MPTVFFSYSYADDGFREQLEKQLTMHKQESGPRTARFHSFK